MTADVLALAICLAGSSDKPRAVCSAPAVVIAVTAVTAQRASRVFITASRQLGAIAAYFDRNFMPSSSPLSVSGYMRSSSKSRMMPVDEV